MKPIVYLMSALMLVATAEAKKKGGNAGKNGKNKQEEIQKKKEKEERDRRHDAVKQLLDAKDKDHDGSLTKDEYIAGEADPEAARKKFDEFNKNRDRSLSKSEIEKLLGL